MLFRNQFIHPGVMMRAKLLKALRYHNVPTCEDYDLWTRAMKHCKVANCPDVLMLYRWHGKNISIVNQPSLRKSMIGIISRMLTEYMVDHDNDELLLQVMIALGINKTQLIILGKMESMDSWLNKLSSNNSLKNRFGEQFIAREIYEYKKLYEFD
jgi:hypothetical protein